MMEYKKLETIDKTLASLNNVKLYSLQIEFNDDTEFFLRKNQQKTEIKTGFHIN